MKLYLLSFSLQNLDMVFRYMAESIYIILSRLITLRTQLFNITRNSIYCQFLRQSYDQSKGVNWITHFFLLNINWGNENFYEKGWWVIILIKDTVNLMSQFLFLVSKDIFQRKLVYKSVHILELYDLSLYNFFNYYYFVLQNVYIRSSAICHIKCKCFIICG